MEKKNLCEPLFSDYYQIRERFHSPYADEKIREGVQDLIQRGYDRFIIPLLDMLDIYVAIEMSKCAVSNPQVEFSVVLREGQYDRAGENTKLNVEAICSFASEVVITSREWQNRAFLYPHDYLVNVCGLSLGYTAPYGDGGTLYIYRACEVEPLPLAELFDIDNQASPFRE